LPMKVIEILTSGLSSMYLSASSVKAFTVPGSPSSQTAISVWAVAKALAKTTRSATIVSIAATLIRLIHLPPSTCIERVDHELDSLRQSADNTPPIPVDVLWQPC